MYLPEIGRWTSSDPAASPWTNLNGYVGNPVQWRDTTGLVDGLGETTETAGDWSRTTNRTEIEGPGGDGMPGSKYIYHRQAEHIEESPGRLAAITAPYEIHWDDDACSINIVVPVRFISALTLYRINIVNSIASLKEEVVPAPDAFVISQGKINEWKAGVDAAWDGKVHAELDTAGDSFGICRSCKCKRISLGVDLVEAKAGQRHTGVFVTHFALRGSARHWSYEFDGDTAAHEVGHFMGLRDEYNEASVIGRPADPGDGLMGDFRGNPSQATAVPRYYEEILSRELSLNGMREGSAGRGTACVYNYVAGP
ncbi:MAG: hypothetical protein IT463_00470 [Planctomycetes bacterium]|nr:hypothetical protein [Planctomycetota bacterium]